jgi:type IV pilus assembly protein PilY1
MSFGVYEHNIDYGDMFDYFYTLNDTEITDYIEDSITNSDLFYQNHQERNKIFLWKGKIGVTITSVEGKDVAFTGDAADPNYLWYMSSLVDTHTLIDSEGNLSGDEKGTQRLTVDSEGNILFDGNKLPLGKDIKLHDMQSLYDGTLVDRGFGGLINAPGYYFSGYEGVTAGSLDVAEDGDDYIYFFVTGNWVNMQAMYNLHYVSSGEPAWKTELYKISQDDWALSSYNLDYPEGDGVLYQSRLSERDTELVISHPGATQMQIIFHILMLKVMEVQIAGTTIMLF